MPRSALWGSFILWRYAEATHVCCASLCDGLALRLTLSSPPLAFAFMCVTQRDHDDTFLAESIFLHLLLLHFGSIAISLPFINVCRQLAPVSADSVCLPWLTLVPFVSWLLAPGGEEEDPGRTWKVSDRRARVDAGRGTFDHHHSFYGHYDLFLCRHIYYVVLVG